MSGPTRREPQFAVMGRKNCHRPNNKTPAMAGVLLCELVHQAVELTTIAAGRRIAVHGCQNIEVGFLGITGVEILPQHGEEQIQCFLLTSGLAVLYRQILA